MYAMNVVASCIFRIMMFLHDEKVVNIDYIINHPLGASNSPNNMISTINNATFSNQIVGLGIFKDASLLGIYQKDPPLSLPRSVYILSSQ